MPALNSVISYRPEIDGLRAISVIAVLIYHAQFQLQSGYLLGGGFIGVDIFFVISGYLICKIILRELESGSFSFTSFYHRRARRILPALFFVLAVIIPYSWVLVLPKEMKEIAGSGLASLAFGSNIWFWLEDSYTAAPSLLKPLLHTWSLSVEEQFYLFFPIIVILTMRYCRQQLHLIFWTLFAASLIYAETLSRSSVDANFYLIPSRAWELLIGSLLAVYELRRPSSIKEGWLNRLMPTLGLVMILSSFILMSESTRHPSIFTLVPVVGCALVIFFAPKSGGEISVSILGSVPFRYIGLISYSLYLWHYPVFAFARIKDDFGTLEQKLEAIAISFALALLSYCLIEQPMRSAKRLGKRVFWVFIIVSFIGLASVYAYIYKTDGAEFRIPADISEVVDFNYFNDKKRDAIFSHYLGCWVTGATYDADDPFTVCRSSEIEDPNLPVVYLIGDSHAGSMLPGVLHVLKEKANVRQRVVESCLPIYERLRPWKKSNVCFNVINSAYDEVTEVNPNLVIIAGRWRNRDFEYIQQHIREIKKQTSAELVLVGPLIYWDPALPKFIKQELEKSALEFPELLSPDPNTFVMDQILSNIAEHEKVSYLSPVKALCIESRCKTRVNQTAQGISAYDHDHLTEAASIYIALHQQRVLLEALNKIVDKPVE